ncbi:unnamed protein product [Prorocentrum cordatum]|uniref:Alpha-galactosidase n=1 Tax=Prorocentrum cordatum TaxID=2364126 RepID=A0ABN9VIX5_9DINO|nr:unnamed protein product [Polarella glacialis]
MVLPFPRPSADTAQLAVPSAFGSHMVLQRGRATRLWGTAAAGTGPVTVEYRGREVASAALDPSTGRWEAWLPAMNASAEPASVEIRSADGAAVTLTDVVVGDVYACIGASQMEWNLGDTPDNRTAEHDASGSGGSLRLVVADKNFFGRVNPHELQDNFSTRWPWQRADADLHSTMGSSAICFWFGLEQLRRRPEVPVGLVEAFWGATSARQWAPSEAFAKCGMPEKTNGDHGKWWEPRDTSVLWNTMVHPFTALPVRALLVELLVLDGDCLLPAMVRSWRERWAGPGDASGPPLLAMQAACGPSNATARRDATSAFLRAPQTAVVVVADLCDPEAEHHVHSRRKKDEALRLALLAEGLVHGNRSVPRSGPRPVAACCAAEGCARLRVSFDQELAVRPEAAAADCGFALRSGNRSHPGASRSPASPRATAAPWSSRRPPAGPAGARRARAALGRRAASLTARRPTRGCRWRTAWGSRWVSSSSLSGAPAVEPTARRAREPAEAKIGL